MTRLERWILHLTALLTGVTGLIYGWLRYFGQLKGEFGMEAHPLQGALQHLHVLGSPLLVFTLGMLLRGHVLPMWRAGRPAGRTSGLLLALVVAPMALSGYAVQVVVEPRWRLLFAWVHGVSSLLFLGVYAGHQLTSQGQARAHGEAAPDASLNPS